MSLQLVAAGSADEFIPECCGVAEACAVQLHGWAPSGNVLCMDGVQPLQQRRYLCRTHDRVFTVTDQLMCGTLYKQFGWVQVQPEPLIIRHKQTYLSGELLADIIAMFEKNVTINQIVNIIQHRWAAVFAQNASEFARHTSTAAETVPWWSANSGHEVLTDRRKVFAIISAYFDHFLRQKWQAGLATARRQLCYGLSMDETFKVALKCSVKVLTRDGKIKFRKAPYAVHTVFSLQTRMCVGFRFMPDKSNEQKEVLVREVFEAQAQNTTSDVVVTRFVSTDCPDVDKNMLLRLHAEVFAGHPLAGLLDVGDDLYHVLLRIGRVVPAGSRWMKSSLLAVLKRGISGICGCKPDTVSMEQWQLVCAGKLSHELDAWVARYDPDDRVRQQISIAQSKLHHLFAFLPHAEQLMDAGTTSNEHGNWCLNRRTKFVAHMRPDHTCVVLEYTLYLRNRAAAGRCAERADVPAAVKAVANNLFANSAAIAFDEVAARGDVPFLLPDGPVQKQYTLADYTAESGPVRSDRRQQRSESDSSDSISSAGDDIDVDSISSASATDEAEPSAPDDIDAEPSASAADDIDAAGIGVVEGRDA